MEFLNFISNTFVRAIEGGSFSKVSPFDASVLGNVTESSAMDFIVALQAAKKAVASFRSSTYSERALSLEKMASFLSEHASEISFQEALHQGLSADFVNEVSVRSSVRLIHKVSEDLRSYVPKQEIPSAVGVIGIITPWVCSLKMVLERAIPAVAAGNAVLIKVSPLSPITAKVIGDAVLASGLPPGVMQVLQGKKEIAELIAGHPGIRAISAVGSPSTLEAIAKAGVGQIKKMQLSGGAKNSAIVLADCDFENEMPQILRPFLVGQGQLCFNMSRLFIPEAIASAFLEKAQKFIEDLEPLKDPRGQSMWTPLINSSSVETLSFAMRKGLEEHGKLVTGGEALNEGFFVRPVLMKDLPQCSVFQQDEVAGPLILVTPVKYQHEAVKWANTSYLGHSAIVWGSSEKAEKVGGQLEASYVWANGWINFHTPTILGQKQSSFGNPDMSWRGSFYSDVKKLAQSF